MPKRRDFGAATDDVLADDGGTEQFSDLYRGDDEEGQAGASPMVGDELGEDDYEAIEELNETRFVTPKCCWVGGVIGVIFGVLSCAFLVVDYETANDHKDGDWKVLLFAPMLLSFSVAGLVMLGFGFYLRRQQRREYIMTKMRVYEMDVKGNETVGDVDEDAMVNEEVLAERKSTRLEDEEVDF